MAREFTKIAGQLETEIANGTGSAVEYDFRGYSANQRLSVELF